MVDIILGRKSVQKSQMFVKQSHLLELTFNYSRQIDDIGKIAYTVLAIGRFTAFEFIPKLSV
jgi:hypothetical protein